MKHSNFKIGAIAGAVLAALAYSGAAAADENARYVVHFKDGSHNEVRSAILAARGNVKYQIQSMNAVAIEASGDGVKQLKSNKHIAAVEEDAKRYPLGSATSSTGAPYLSGQEVPYGIKMVQADQLPNGDANAGNRKVCIIDSGYDRTHEDLSGNNVTGEYDSVSGWWYDDESHHGTHVAGTIAGINNSGVGVVGVNPNRKLKLHIVKVFNKDGWAYSSSLAAAANKCKAAGANVITMSLGGGKPTETEKNTFSSLADAGILLIAAAGNGGNNPDPAIATAVSYPAGYPSVMSVAAVDEKKNWANFSQYNNKVEIAGPGVNVLSTVPIGTGRIYSAKVADTTFRLSEMQGSPSGSASGILFDFGLGDKTNSAAAGKICLIKRGGPSFSAKVKNCESSGGVGAIVYNNVAGEINGTLGTLKSNIPSVVGTESDGAEMRELIGKNAVVSVKTGNYAFYDGTSMATPHVSAVAALVWSYFPDCTGAQMRVSLTKSALDLGSPGRDVKYGYGLVQAKAAYDRIKSLGCGK